jgi:hypothetical protein
MHRKDAEGAETARRVSTQPPIKLILFVGGAAHPGLAKGGDRLRH